MLLTSAGLPRSSPEQAVRSFTCRAGHDGRTDRSQTMYCHSRLRRSPLAEVVIGAARSGAGVATAPPAGLQSRSRRDGTGYWRRAIKEFRLRATMPRCAGQSPECRWRRRLVPSSLCAEVGWLPSPACGSVVAPTLHGSSPRL